MFCLAWHHSLSKKYEKKNPHQVQNLFYVVSLLNPKPPTKTNATIKTYVLSCHLYFKQTSGNSATTQLREKQNCKSTSLVYFMSYPKPDSYFLTAFPLTSSSGILWDARRWRMDGVPETQWTGCSLQQKMGCLQERFREFNRSALVNCCACVTTCCHQKQLSTSLSTTGRGLLTCHDSDIDPVTLQTSQKL